MKTTLELPDDLVLEMKLRAVRERRKLKDVAAEVFRRGLSSSAADPSSALPQPARVQLPLVPRPPGAKNFTLSAAQIHDLEMKEELTRHAASLRQ